MHKRSFRNTSPLSQAHLRKLQSHELGELLSYIGDGVGVVAGEPLGVAGLEVSGHGALALDVAADVEVGYGYQQVGAGVVMHGDCGSGLEFEFGGADSVVYEEDLFGAAFEDVE